MFFFVFQLTRSSLNAVSFRQIIRQRSTPPPATGGSRLDQSFLIEHSSDLNAINRTILINSAASQRGFLPHEYRTTKTMEIIRQERKNRKTPLIVSSTNQRQNNRLPMRLDAFGNANLTMNKLSEQRLILREKLLRKKLKTPMRNKDETNSTALGQANFASDIPNALELMIHSKAPSAMEHQLYESLKRDHLQQGRYRLLPVTRISLA